ncbi:MAG: hypothetical protein ACREON_13245 [Gemmatimonadaceae bacterium]
MPTQSASVDDERPDLLPDEPERRPDPEPVPWHDPGPPVRKVNLPPDNPTPGVPVDNPDRAR